MLYSNTTVITHGLNQCFTNPRVNICLAGFSQKLSQNQSWLIKLFKVSEAFGFHMQWTSGLGTNPITFFSQKVGKIVIYKLQFYLSFEVEISVYIRASVLHFKQITLTDFGFSQCLGTLLTRNYTRGNIYCRYTCTGVVCLRKFSSFVSKVK